MPAKNSYRDWLKQDLGELIQALDLTDLQKHFLRSRWLDQVLWMEARADNMSSWYHRLRVITVVGSTLIPGLLSALFLAEAGSISQLTTHVIILIVSLFVAALIAVEEFFHLGERWRHYRRTVEGLKTEGWQFFQLSGAYRAQSHAEAYPAFAGRVEEILQQDIEGYIQQVVAGKEEEKPKPAII